MRTRPIGIRFLIWSWVRGIHDPRAWGKPCARCGMAGCVHYWTESLIDCRRYKGQP